MSRVHGLSALPMLLATASLLGTGGVALAQTTGAAAAQTSAASDIIVTGTRRLDRTLTESPVPVDVLDSSALQQQAPADMNEVLKNLVPSFNIPKVPLSDGSTFVRPPTLRGLPPDEILVLINGKRYHKAAVVQIFGGSLAAGSQGVDLSNIPSIAVDRIEVLRDGAAAQYGSDAIAGVINYTLKKNSSGLSAIARYGQYYRGDGKNYQIAADWGLPLGDGFLNVSGEFVDSGMSAPGGQRIGAAILQLQHPEYDIPNPANSIGDPKIRAYRTFLNAGMPVTDDSQIYMFANYSKTMMTEIQNWRQPIDLVGEDRWGEGTELYPHVSGVFDTIYLDRLANGNYDATGATWNANSMYPQGFAPVFKGDVIDMSLTSGYKGTTSFDLNYDLSASWGQNRIDYYSSNTLNPSMGPATPTSFYDGRLQQQELNFNADFSYAWEIGLASPLTVAFGGERRRETYTIGIGDPNSYLNGPYSFQTVQNPDLSTFDVAMQIGTNGFPGSGPDSAVDNSRSSYALYLDLEGDILTNLSAGLAVRHEHFSDFGNTTNFKGTLRYAINDIIALRGAASTGFRAPTPGQLFTTNVATSIRGGVPIESAIYPATSAASTFFGGQALKPEKSKNYSVGMVVTPGGSLTATLDAYQIDVNDRIGLSGNFDITDDAQRNDLRALGVENWATLARLRYFTNAFATRTQGVDFVLNHSMTTEYGRFSTTLAANYNKTKVRSYDPAVLDRERIGNIQNLVPKVRGNLTENWTFDRYGLMARASYIGSFKDFELPEDGGDKRFGAEWQFDLEASYKVTDYLRLIAGAENIFNNYPDRDMRAMGLHGLNGDPMQNWYAMTDAEVAGDRYPGSSPLGYNGGFWYIRAALDF